MNVIGVIPARLGSTRLSEKVLRPIAGRPMIQHVWERAKRAKKLKELIVACDHPRVESCVRGFGGTVMMTRADHPNGSSRVAEVASLKNADYFINIQGDEPTMHPEGIDQLVETFEQDPAIEVATLAVRREDRADYENPNVVKVVCDRSGNALYFSRSPIPCYRDQTSQPFSYLKHLGIYGYQRDFLLKFVTWEMGVLENKEKLEQLRILERGFSIRVIETAHDSWSVDTQEDLDIAEAKINLLSQKSGAC
ncbi:MAG: 3-deoxy-manno-octulosonate cytidylyltransferase [Candidatus Omnitrophica bacterium]|nr:3-deoxy-manno-octulosonate cytidylyltransferase [Candidatus Omnitrophota bacterium]